MHDQRVGTRQRRPRWFAVCKLPRMTVALFWRDRSHYALSGSRAIEERYRCEWRVRHSDFLSRHNRGPRFVPAHHSVTGHDVRASNNETAGFDPFCGISLFCEYFTFPKLRGLSGLNLRKIPSGSTGVLCPPSAKFLTTFQKNLPPLGVLIPLVTF